MIPPMIGNLIVIAALVAVAALAVRSIWKGHKKGGHCGGDCGQCGGCHHKYIFSPLNERPHGITPVRLSSFHMGVVD